MRVHYQMAAMYTWSRSPIDLQSLTCYMRVLIVSIASLDILPFLRKPGLTRSSSRSQGRKQWNFLKMVAKSHSIIRVTYSKTRSLERLIIKSLAKLNSQTILTGSMRGTSLAMLRRSMYITLIFTVFNRPQDFFTGEIICRGQKKSDVYGNYLGFIDFDGKRYWDIREQHVFPV